MQEHLPVLGFPNDSKGRETAPGLVDDVDGSPQPHCSVDDIPAVCQFYFSTMSYLSLRRNI